MGAFTSEKGQDVAAQAADLLRPRLPHLRMVLAGEGPLRSSLQANTFVRFPGDVSCRANSWRLWTCSSCLRDRKPGDWPRLRRWRMGSRWLLPASADCGNIEDDESGWLVAPGDAGGLAGAIEWRRAIGPTLRAIGMRAARSEAIFRRGDRVAQRSVLRANASMSVSSRNANIGALLLCVLFVLVAIPWIGKPGIQTDEALFAGGIYPPFNEQFTIHIFHHAYPLMEMSYVGALKVRIWALIFKVWRPSPASVRVPADDAGGAFDLVVLSIDVRAS